MSDNLFSKWTSCSKERELTTVVPDGCRDLIVKTVGDQPPQWFVSPLFNQSQLIWSEENTNLVGFRFSPGLEIAEEKLLNYTKQTNFSSDKVADQLGEFVSVNSSINEALECLANDGHSINQVSSRLGVSTRTLQRFILKKTGRTPSYWFQLARVRKAAKELTGSAGLSDIADSHGFSDQSHMNREFQKWFNITPLEFRNSPDLICQINETGYG